MSCGEKPYLKPETSESLKDSPKVGVEFDGDNLKVSIGDNIYEGDDVRISSIYRCIGSAAQISILDGGELIGSISGNDFSFKDHITGRKFYIGDQLSSEVKDRIDGGGFTLVEDNESNEDIIDKTGGILAMIDKVGVENFFSYAEYADEFKYINENWMQISDLQVAEFKDYVADYIESVDVEEAGVEISVDRDNLKLTVKGGSFIVNRSYLNIDQDLRVGAGDKKRESMTRSM